MIWRLTPGLSFSDVEDTLLSLKNRLGLQGKELKEFFIDNCCSWRNCLQRVFGAQLKVYLDLFHAIKRVTEKIPKRHSLRSEYINHLCMVFRDTRDRGPERKMKTPDSHVLAKQLKEFEDKWKDIKYNGVPVLSTAAIKEIRNLEVHINKGCLSNIRPGRGKNRNEALHRSINRIIRSSRYGVELAYALLSTCFYNHNEHQTAVKEHQVAKPIEAYEEVLKEVHPVETFGLTLSSRGTDSSSKKVSSAQGLPPLDINKFTYRDFFECLSGNTDNHLLKSRALLQSSDDESDDDDKDSDSDQTSLLAAKGILLSALGLYFIHKNLTSLSSAAVVHRSQLPFMNTLLSDVFYPKESISQVQNGQIHRKRLDDVLSTWNFKRVSIPGDGNCLFRAVTVNLQSAASRNKFLNDHLHKLGIQVHVSEDSVEDIMKKLRKLVVEELSGDKLITQMNTNLFCHMNNSAQRCNISLRMVSSQERLVTS